MTPPASPLGPFVLTVASLPAFSVSDPLYSLYITAPRLGKHHTLFKLQQTPPPLFVGDFLMEGSDTATNTTFPLSSSPSSSPTSSPPPPPPLPLHEVLSPPPIVLSPCAACKILRRRCVDKCVLAPYFPPNEPLKFTTAHKVFGASNIIKLLQDLPESQRADAVSSMVYEANARIRDPVYGCAGAICQLQKQVSELQAHLAKAQAELFNMQTQHANLVAIFCMEMAQSYNHQPATQLAHDSLAAAPNLVQNDACFLDDSGQTPLWETLWA